MSEMTNRQRAEALAAERAAAALAGADLAARSAALGLPPPQADGSLRLRAFGQDLRFAPPAFEAVIEPSGQPARQADRILVLHYLVCDLPLEPTGQLITFREMPGGQFYWEPFRSRSVRPLLARIGNDLDLLREHLGRFDWQPLVLGDLGASIHVVGKISMTLVYHTGNEEFEPEADVLFDACVRRVFVAEDVVAIASRICLGLL